MSTGLPNCTGGSPSTMTMTTKWRRPNLSPRALFASEHRRERLAGALTLALLFYLMVWHGQRSLLSPATAQFRTFASSSSSSCAILLYGSLHPFPVLWPALRRHVILPNAAYGCDYFVHTWQEEETDRPQQQAVETMQKYFAQELSRDPLTRHLPRPATLHISFSTDDDFQQAHADLLHRVDTVMDQQGRSIYIPWKEEDEQPSDETTSAIDILKTWHAMQKAWQHMEQYQQQYARHYARVAVLRLDTLPMTSVDMYQIDSTRRDVYNKHVVFPGFGKYPLNDRGIYGPAPAVRLWVTERFRHVDAYVQEFRWKRPGSGIHSERYMDQFLLPRLQSLLPRYRYVDREDWCFYRTQANHAVQISDCSLPGHARREDAVAYVTGCTCTEARKRSPDVREIECCLNQTATLQ